MRNRLWVRFREFQLVAEGIVPVIVALLIVLVMFVAFLRVVDDPENFAVRMAHGLQYFQGGGGHIR